MQDAVKLAEELIDSGKHRKNSKSLCHSPINWQKRNKHMILETIAEATRKRVAAEKEKCSLAEMKEKATAMNPDTGFRLNRR